MTDRPDDNDNNQTHLTFFGHDLSGLFKDDPSLPDKIEITGDPHPLPKPILGDPITLTVTYDDFDVNETMVHYAIDLATRNQESSLAIANMTLGEALKNYQIACDVLAMLDKDQTDSEVISLVTKLADDLKTLYSFD